MIRFTNIENGRTIESPRPERISSTTLEQAATAFREGKTVGLRFGDRFLLMDSGESFTCDFKYLVEGEWIIF